MEQGKMSFPAGEGLDITATNFDALISMAEHSDDLWIIKGNNHEFAYANKIYRHYLDLPENYNVEGRLVGDMPVIHADYQEEIHAADDKVIFDKKNIPEIFNTIYGGKNKFSQRFIGEAMPLLKEGESVGVIVRARKLELFTLDNVISNELPEVIQFGNPSELFSDREFEVVFYML